MSSSPFSINQNDGNVIKPEFSDFAFHLHLGKTRVHRYSGRSRMFTSSLYSNLEILDAKIWSGQTGRLLVGATGWWYWWMDNKTQVSYSRPVSKGCLMNLTCYTWINAVFVNMFLFFSANNILHSGVEMDSQQQQFCLKWNSFGSNLATSFSNLFKSESLADVTLFCDGEYLW